MDKGGKQGQMGPSDEFQCGKLIFDRNNLQSKVTGATIEDAVKELQKHSWDLQVLFCDGAER